MMNSITVDSANELWSKLVDEFINSPNVQLQKSRRGDTDEILHFWITLNNPSQRFMTTRFPSINPAFAIAEIIWIINGRNDASFINKWNSQLCKYAGNGKSYYGAYGHRLRINFDIDQLKRAYKALKNNPLSRQIVLQIWDPQKDLPLPSGKAKNKDIPCNITSLLKVRNNRLDWVQIMRSNDLFRGLPYNIIQFTTLQEVIAGWIGVKPGKYFHYSDSLHLYHSDRQCLSEIHTPTEIVNNDSLFLPYRESIKLFKSLEHKVESIISNQISEKSLLKIHNWSSAPRSFRNMLSLLSAEIARKARFYTLADNFMEECTNDIYKHLWKNWIKEKIK